MDIPAELARREQRLKAIEEAKRKRARRAAERQAVPEPVFGIIKFVLGFRQCLLRGEKMAEGEWTLAGIAWSLKRIYNLSCRQPRMACATD